MKTNKLKVGFVQCSIQHDDPFLNKSALRRTLKRLLRHSPQLVLLPEICLGSTPSKNCRNKYIQAYADLQIELLDLSKKFDVGFYGSFWESVSKNRFGNVAKFIHSKQTPASTYQKIHLFRMGNEHKMYEAGSQSKVFTTPWGKAAPLVCYDIRFPELLRQQVFNGAQMALVCAQWPASRRDHWLTLLKARALENQIYILACNRIGQHNKLTFSGDSCVISPWGEIEFLMTSKKQSGIFEINLNNIKEIRSKFPFLKEAHKKYFHFDI